MGMNSYNYEKLMKHKPTSYGKHINSLGQEIDFMEHPVQGEASYVICVCHELKLATDSCFFETDDMTADHKEYEPSFQNGLLFIGVHRAWD